MEKLIREKGFINLDDYFKNKYEIEEINIEKLDSKNIIRQELGGISLSFWLDFFGYDVLFKDSEGMDKAYIELINEEFIKNIGLKSAHYDLAKFNNKLGVISYNFKKENYVYKDLYSILSEYYSNVILGNEKKYDLPKFKNVDDATDKLNNLDDIWSSFEFYYKDNPNKNKIIKNLMHDLVKLFIYDLFMNQSDRHASNFLICENKNDKSDIK